MSDQTDGPLEYDKSGLRHCPKCNFDVNHTEWKLCRKVECNCSFREMAEVGSKSSPGCQDMIITTEQRRAFVMGKGMNCPVCCLDEVMALEEPKAVEDNKLTRTMMCPNHHVWHEVFTLTGVMTDKQHRLLYPQETEPVPT